MHSLKNLSGIAPPKSAQFPVLTLAPQCENCSDVAPSTAPVKAAPGNYQSFGWGTDPNVAPNAPANGATATAPQAAATATAPSSGSGLKWLLFGALTVVAVVSLSSHGDGLGCPDDSAPVPPAPALGRPPKRKAQRPRKVGSFAV